MSKDIELEHIADPTGQVLVWSRIVDPLNIGDARLIGTYSTYDGLSFFKRAIELSLPADSILAAIKVREEFEEMTGFPWYAAAIDLKSEDVLRTAQEDVLFAGRFSSEIVAAAKVAMKSVDYHDRALELLKKGRIKAQSGNPSLFDAFGGNAQQVRDYVTTKYVNPMIFARLQNDTNKLKELKEQFTETCRGTVYWNEAADICKEIEKVRLSPLDTSSIDMIVEKMAARSRSKTSPVSFSPEARA